MQKGLDFLFALGKPPALLAPMAGVTDAAFRGICREMGADFSYTEMVSAKGLQFNNKNTTTLLRPAEIEQSAGYGVQLFGADPDIIGKMAGELSRNQPMLKLIDINMGCPAHKIIANGEGSALMKNEPLAARVISAAVKASALPITVKFRKGFDEEHINALSFAKMAEDSGAAMLCVHGRTREQMYSGKADWDIIAQIKAAVKIPVIGNGDIFSGEAALNMLRYTGCDGIMIARGAEGNPFIFREINAALAGEAYTPPNYAQRIAAAVDHAERLTQSRGERALVEMRKHVSWYLSGMRSSAALRGRVNSITSLAELKTLLYDYLASVEAQQSQN